MNSVLGMSTSPPTTPSQATSPGKGRPITVLLVDDQATMNEAIQCLLATENDITYHYCSTADQALTMAIEVAPTVILQDLIMPGADGMALVKQFRTQAATQDVPIIMFSTNDDPQTKAEAFAVGVNDYLVKLPDRIELLARIRYHSQAYLNRQAHTAALVAQEQAQELEQILQELRCTQAQLIQTEKLSSLGQMLAGIAHEINNPVNFIFGNLTYIENYVSDLMRLVHAYQGYYPEPGDEIQTLLEDMDYEFLTQDLEKILASTRLGVERIIQIILSLRNFSRQDQAEMRLSNLHEGIDSTLLILGHRIKQGIEIIKQYGELPPIECYPAQLNQVFMNILNNAIDALEENSTLANPQDSAHTGCGKQIFIQTQRQDENRVEVRIRDTGVGIPADILDQLFTPFFTTKPVGKGTGLGLSICQQIIKNHQGSLQVVSQPGQGTEFIIQLLIEH
ncbi:MAG: hybrid sensor histidine kinase/response regulator [Leptodesmis sp.]|uniref:hybrid sensor histidine kinase/response regulator n=1 Tax=Leptodesmis sp. TaxID=3100501 RepID=UPI003D136EE1